MENKQLMEEYKKYVDKISPKTKPFPTLIYAFIVGGLICLLGEGIGAIIKLIDSSLPRELISGYVNICLIFLASFFTGIGLYDRLGAVAGAGSIIPITGFSNSIASPAMEYKHEGFIFGVCVKMFSIAGPVIVNGVVASVLVGIVYLFI